MGGSPTQWINIRPLADPHPHAPHFALAEPTQFQQLKTIYPLIDADPHFKRVVSYFRPSDYVAWASATAAFPSALYLMGPYSGSRIRDLLSLTH